VLINSLLVLLQNLDHNTLAALRILDEERVGFFLDLILAVGLDDEVVFGQAVCLVDDHESAEGDAAFFQNCHVLTSRYR
jgi:hypothetical protein